MGEFLKRFIKTDIAPFMKEKGYKKTNANFYKTTDLFIFMVNIQGSAYNDVLMERFYINCGIYSPQVALSMGLEPLEKPVEYKCHFRSRIEKITGSTKQYFDINGDTDMVKLGEEIRSELEKADSFFMTVDSMEKFLDITRTDDTLIYNLVNKSYDDVNAYIRLQEKRFSGEERWERIYERLKNTCAKYGYNI